MIKGRFFQSIQNETGTEAGVEEHVQGTVEVVVGDGLAEYSNAFLRAVVEVFRDLDGVGRDDFAVDSSFLGTVSHPGVVEAGVGEGEDEAATGFDDLANATHQGVDLGHVHDRHVADGSVEARLPEGDDLVFAGGIDEAVFEAWKSLPSRILSSQNVAFLSQALRVSSFRSIGWEVFSVVIAGGFLSGMFGLSDCILPLR